MLNCSFKLQNLFRDILVEGKCFGGYLTDV